jgi:uncharacterized protein involved in exopolysaccharide biosynthesis
MAELALEQTLDLGDYLSAFRRRRILIALVAGTVLLVGLITAYVWPPTYQSMATILIEEQEVPADLIRSTVTSYAAQRIQVISQRVMTRSNLTEIIEKYQLYESDRKRKTMEQVLAAMRDDIGVDMITAEVLDPRTGRPGSATIAFTVGFKGERPEQVQKVASELTTLYLNENLKTRTEKAEETYVFLTEEAKRLSEEISSLEARLAEFQEKNANRLPELKDLNIRIIERTQQQMDEIVRQIQSLEEQKVYLGGQLALLDPYSSGQVMSPTERLDALRTEYITLASRYSPDHPDVTRVKREIQALEKETGDYGTSEDLHVQLDALQKELDMAEQVYTHEHPDVKSLKRQIAALEEELRNPSGSSARREEAPVNPDNPAYVNLQTQIAAANSEIRSLKSRRAQLAEKIADHEQRLQATPQVEREFRRITRDLANATKRYHEIKAKQMTAEVGQSLEKERKGERFTLIDPAVMPEQPISPNRPAIILLSLVLALGAGIGSAAVAESLDSAVRGEKGVAAILHTAPMAVIPYLDNAAETARQKNRRILVIVSIIGGIIILVLLVHFLFSPLDVLWFRGIRKVDSIVGG